MNERQDAHEERTGERSSRVEVDAPRPPRESQRSTTDGETSANRGSNLEEEKPSRGGRPRFPESDRSSQGGSRKGSDFEDQKGNDRRG